MMRASRGPRLLGAWLLLLQLLSGSAEADESLHQRPAAAYAPLFTAVVKLSEVPEYGSPGAPALLAPKGRKRRHYDFPQATELSEAVLPRVIEDTSAAGRRRRLLLLQGGKQQQQQQRQQRQRQRQPDNTRIVYGGSDEAVATAQAVLDQQQARPPGGRQLQEDSSRRQRPGWSGLWWAEAGAVGLAAGPSHVLHAVSTVLAVYTVRPDTGAHVSTKTYSLQDLFAPVRGANCKDGVYDAVPAYDKLTKRFLVAATCGGRGAALLAVSATPDPTGSWFLLNLVADAAGTGMECRSPPEAAVADSVRLTYDANGVYLSLFNYCPSNPSTRGATILALPKNKAYKGAPNFVYAAFSADQILAALPADRRTGLVPSSFRQCQPAPPQAARDAAEANAAYFVCDHVGPDASVPRDSLALVALVNTGALWQFASTRETSPTCFLVATLVGRGMDAPLSKDVMLGQPGRGDPLHAGGTRPAGFWSGSAVLSEGRVYTVDRVDVRSTPKPPVRRVTMPSLMWMEIDVKASVSGGGDCTRTFDWGSKWDWSKDWSVDWGSDFDLVWDDTVAAAEELKRREAARHAAHEALLANCTAAAAAEAGEPSPGATAPQTAQPPAEPPADSAGAGATEVSDGAEGTVLPEAAAQGPSNCSALAAAALNDSTPAEASGGGRRRLAAAAAQERRQAGRGRELLQSGTAAAISNAYTTGAFSGWDLGCWYCYTGGGLVYSNGWFYRYWYNQWDFGWYAAYKRSYAPGWVKPTGKWGHRRLAQASGGPAAAQNETLVLPPCLLAGRSYKNTCKQCNYTGASAALAAAVARSGVIAEVGERPLGFVAPALAVTPGGALAIVTGYSGPGLHPANDLPAYPGIASLTITPHANGTNATALWRVLRLGVGTVRSASGRWADFSSLDATQPPAGAKAPALAAAAATTTAADPAASPEQAAEAASAAATAAATARLWFGVQWSQRPVECGGTDGGTAAADSAEAACAMPGPWIGHVLSA